MSQQISKDRRPVLNTCATIAQRQAKSVGINRFNSNSIAIRCVLTTETFFVSNVMALIARPHYLVQEAFRNKRTRFQK